MSHQCLKSGLCCLEGTIVTEKEAEIISSIIKIDRDEFLNDYRKFTNAENQYKTKVINGRCCFLKKDNTCRIYHIRPAVCKDYPYNNKLCIRELNENSNNHHSDTSTKKSS